MKKRMKNQQGMTLIELMIVVAILTLVATAVANIMINTTWLVMRSSRESSAETTGKAVLSRIAEDVRMAFDTNISGGAGAFWDASGPTNIVISVRENKDQYAVPSNGDNLWDVSCYQWVPPVGDYGTPAYRPGYVTAGTDNGDSMCSVANTSVLSDATVDVIGFNIEYCRPADGVPGTYSCSNNVSEPGTITTSSECVWLVKMQIKTRRLPVRNQDPGYLTAPVAMYSTAVKPRNLYLMSLATDNDKNAVVDCCDANFVGTDVSWCPPPTKF